MASLQENRTVLNCIPYTFPQRDFHCRPNYQEEDPQRARICKHSMCGFGPIGEIMAADLYRADAQPEVTGSVLEDLDSLHSRARIENMDRCMSCGLLNVVPAELCGEAFHEDRLRGACFPS